MKERLTDRREEGRKEKHKKKIICPFLSLLWHFNFTFDAFQKLFYFSFFASLHNRYVTEVDCSSGQFKSAKLKDKEYTINAPIFTQYCKKRKRLMHQISNIRWIMVNSCTCIYMNIKPYYLATLPKGNVIWQPCNIWYDMIWCDMII